MVPSVVLDFDRGRRAGLTARRPCRCHRVRRFYEGAGVVGYFGCVRGNVVCNGEVGD